MLHALRHLSGQLRERRFRITPAPEGYQGQKDFAGDFRRAFDEASLSCGSFDVF
jgi:hypothetical protein